MLQNTENQMGLGNGSLNSEENKAPLRAFITNTLVCLFKFVDYSLLTYSAKLAYSASRIKMSQASEADDPELVGRVIRGKSNDTGRITAKRKAPESDEKAVTDTKKNSFTLSTPVTKIVSKGSRGMKLKPSALVNDESGSPVLASGIISRTNTDSDGGTVSIVCPL